jgi:hypothetical protein
MRFTLTVQPGPLYLLLEAAGPMDLGDLCGIFDLVGSVAETNGHHRALFNLLAVQVDLSFTEHLQLGTRAAASLRRLERAASVVSVANRRGTSEKAAQKQGLEFRTFTTIEEAHDWTAEGATEWTAASGRMRALPPVAGPRD